MPLATVPIHTTCPDCGNVLVRSDMMRLMVCDDDLDQSFFSFTCPKCGKRVNRPAPTDVRDKIVAFVPTRHWQARPVPTGPPLTDDDLIRFGLEIEATSNATP